MLFDMLEEHATIIYPTVNTVAKIELKKRLLGKRSGQFIIKLSLFVRDKCRRYTVLYECQE